MRVVGFRLDKVLGGADHYDMRANDVKVADSTHLTCQVPCFKPELVTLLRDRLPAEERLEEGQLLFGALADRTRLKLLLSLRDGQELCVCDVAHVLGVSISSASHHLRKLRDLKVLRSRNDGKMSYYALRDRGIGTLLDQVFPPSDSLIPSPNGIRS